MIGHLDQFIYQHKLPMLLSPKSSYNKLILDTWFHSARLPSLRPFRAISASSVSTGSPPINNQAPPLRYAVIGGGFAGVAVAWHILQRSSSISPIRLDLYDAFGLGSGGSGAAAGLLHPYTPRGKVLWNGLEAFKDAVQLVDAAQDAVSSSSTEEEEKKKEFVWRHGLLRPARNPKQARDFAKNVSKDAETAQATKAEVLKTFKELVKLVPGLETRSLIKDSAEEDALQEMESSHAVGLLNKSAIIIQPRGYLEALWRSCQLTAAASSPYASVTLKLRNISSLAQLQNKEEGPYNGIVVAAGAAIDSITETRGMFPLDVCHGYSLDMECRAEENASGYPEGAPGLLGSPYIAPHGTHKAVVGATQRHDCSPEEAVAALGPGGLIERGNIEWERAVHALVPKAAELWPPIGSNEKWRVAAVRSGFRAIPLRTNQGSIPYAGKIISATSRKENTGGDSKSTVSSDSDGGSENDICPSLWVIGGLGARGLVYHAWLGRLVAAGMLADSEAGFPPELLRWKNSDRRL